jgi:hypothetical protein
MFASKACRQESTSAHDSGMSGRILPRDAPTRQPPVPHTPGMLMRLLGCAVALTVLVSGCGESGYGSTQDVARALDCAPTGSPDTHPEGNYTVQTCRFHGERLAIYWMDEDASSWSGMPWANAFLFGDGPWNVECASHAECVKVQSIIGGDMGQG